MRVSAAPWSRARTLIFMGCLVVAISITEWVFAYRSVRFGIILSLFLTLAAYLVVVLGRVKSPYLECIESMALIPLYILFTSSMPWFFLQQELLLPAVYSLILALCFWHIYERNIGLKEMGFHWRKWGKYALWGIALGAPLGSIEYLILRPAPSAVTFQISHLVRDLVYMLFFVGLAEELLFRGLIQNDLKRAFGWRWSLFLQSFLFMVMHLTWRSVPELFFVFSAAVVLGVMYERTKSMIGIVVLHGVGNTFLVAIMPYVLRLGS